ncbi:hypothetical protein C8A03DRAFT_37960 [Achaetomium macrosporum]|uniref:Uncharacterized protein n=1 Tax=Achaetomium macrosporum TaxID=79813 RepID=A0AAN7C2Y9_9PEZI|nr:hypothetical protein C8A03DRAFT_37960 [Achaetomium macrosporum]
MIQNINPGLSRGFSIASAFQFDDLSDNNMLFVYEAYRPAEGHYREGYHRLHRGLKVTSDRCYKELVIVLVGERAAHVSNSKGPQSPGSLCDLLQQQHEQQYEQRTSPNFPSATSASPYPSQQPELDKPADLHKEKPADRPHESDTGSRIRPTRSNLSTSDDRCRAKRCKYGSSSSVTPKPKSSSENSKYRQLRSAARIAEDAAGEGTVTRLLEEEAGRKTKQKQKAMGARLAVSQLREHLVRA